MFCPLFVGHPFAPWLWRMSHLWCTDCTNSPDTKGHCIVVSVIVVIVVIVVIALIVVNVVSVISVIAVIVVILVVASTKLEPPDDLVLSFLFAEVK